MPLSSATVIHVRLCTLVFARPAAVYNFALAFAKQVEEKLTPTLLGMFFELVAQPSLVFKLRPAAFAISGLFDSSFPGLVCNLEPVSACLRKSIRC